LTLLSIFDDFTELGHGLSFVRVVFLRDDYKDPGLSGLQREAGDQAVGSPSGRRQLPARRASPMASLFAGLDAFGKESRCHTPHARTHAHTR
jgi:hypothetical protein